MFLLDLFENNDFDVTDKIRQSMMDILTPLVARGVGEITVKEVEQRLQKINRGIIVSRALVMRILNPDDVKLITRIEGDKIILNTEKSPKRELNKDDEQKEVEKFKDRASKEAKKSIKKKTAEPKISPDDIKIG